MDYIKLDFGDGTQGYQEIQSSSVVRYVDLLGNTLTGYPKEGNGGTVIDANPPRESWTL